MAEEKANIILYSTRKGQYISRSYRTATLKYPVICWNPNKEQALKFTKTQAKAFNKMYHEAFDAIYLKYITI